MTGAVPFIGTYHDRIVGVFLPNPAGKVFGTRYSGFVIAFGIATAPNRVQAVNIFAEAKETGTLNQSGFPGLVIGKNLAFLPK
ncbi:hypothetical protein D3C85_941400 [compost metagenome]